jgi:ABC-type multidrug transport system permease subunit
MVIILVMSAIGGSMIPTFVMPEIMKKMAVVSINYWSIQSFYDVFGRLLPLKELLPEIAVLMGIGTGMLVISYQIFRKNIVGIFS